MKERAKPHKLVIVIIAMRLSKQAYRGALPPCLQYISSLADTLAHDLDCKFVQQAFLILRNAH